MRIYLYILVMAVTTYLIRMLPLAFFKKPIKNRFIRSLKLQKLLMMRFKLFVSTILSHSLAMSSSMKTI